MRKGGLEMLAFTERIEEQWETARKLHKRLIFTLLPPTNKSLKSHSRQKDSLMKVRIVDYEDISVR